MKTEYFPCIRVTREDLVCAVDNLDEVFVNQILGWDDEEMFKLAYQVGQVLMEGGDFWEACKQLTLNKLKESCSNDIYPDNEGYEYLNTL